MELDRGATRRSVAVDVVIVGVLITIAVLVRVDGLPTHGLWLDDAVEGAARKAPLSQLFTVSQDHPGYVAALMAWGRISGGSDVSLAYPALIAGVLGPPFLYLTLRVLGYTRWICLVLAAALVASQVDIVYSGRLKPDTTDVLVVLVLILLVQRLARTTWRWRTATLWVLAAILLSSVSLFSLVAVAVAGVILVAHPASDLRIRGPAVGVQAACTVALAVAVVENYNTRAVQAQWRQLWDAFITFYPNPLRFGGEVLRHLTRITRVFPGGPGWFATLCVIVAVGGLVLEARRGPRAIVARYLLLVLVIAFVGGVAGKIPFGPSLTNPLVSGGRASLWLVPVVAVGLAAVLQRVRDRVKLKRLPLALDTAAVVGAALTLAFALAATRLLYPLPGAQPAVSFAESHLGAKDALIVAYPAYSFAAESHFPPLIVGDPRGFPGFYPTFADPRIHAELYDPSSQQVASAVAGASRVLVYVSQPALNSTEAKERATIAGALDALGFQSRTFTFQDASVAVWNRLSGAVPKTRLISPSPGAVLSLSTELVASASNTSRLEFRIFGGLYGLKGPVIGKATSTTPGGWTFDWHTTTVPNGSYYLVAEAFNSLNHAFSSVVHVRVKN
jgi:hypothetical protein